MYNVGGLCIICSCRDNSKLCSCGGDRQIFYWDVATGKVIRKFRGHEGEANAVKFNEYSSVVVSAGFDQSLRAWDCRSHSNEPIQVSLVIAFFLFFFLLDFFNCL